MNAELFEQVYDTVRGQRIADLAEGVENAFEPGSVCDRSYRKMLDAYARLCQRLGKVDEDEDVEIIINAFMEMDRVLSKEMFRYGIHFGKLQADAEK